MAEPNPKRFRHSRVPPHSDIHEDVYDSNEEGDFSDLDSLSTSSDSSISLDNDRIDESVETSDCSLISFMDDGPCDVVSKDGTKWWNSKPGDISQVKDYLDIEHEAQLTGGSSKCENYQGSTIYI